MDGMLSYSGLGSISKSPRGRVCFLTVLMALNREIAVEKA